VPGAAPDGPLRPRLLDDREASPVVDLGVLPLLQPGGKDVHDPVLGFEEALDVEVTDEEPLVAGPARAPPFGQ
jgi:hypothetical protein